MKKRILLPLILLLVFATNFNPALASGPNQPSDQIEVEQRGEKLLFHVNDQNAEKVILKVIDRDGTLLANEVFTDEKKLEIDKPKKGIYWVSFKVGKQTSFKRFFVD